MARGPVLNHRKDSVKQYPSIPQSATKAKLLADYAYGFDKLDGSNIRAEMIAGEFVRFGSRNRLLAADHPHLGAAIDLIRTRYEADLAAVTEKLKAKEVTAFFEFFGPRSFAGTHHLDDPKEVVLFDLDVRRRGLLPPDEFLAACGHLKIPGLLHEGPVTPELLARIRDGALPGVTEEGVIFKGRAGKKGGRTIMWKVKTERWLDRLKEHCAGDAALFEKLR